MKNYSPEEKAVWKEKENIIRFQIYCIFVDVLPTEEMILLVKQTCLRYFQENPDKLDVPREVFTILIDELQKTSHAVQKIESSNAQRIEGRDWSTFGTETDEAATINENTVV